MRKLPDFIIIGAQKSGTSSLYRYLEGHPELKLSYRKQMHFFDQFYRKGINWYRAGFPLEAFNRTTKTGEATPFYIFHPYAAERMHRHLSEVKLIVMLRNPIDRAHSHYQMKKDQGWETAASFEAALELEQTRIEPELEKMLEDPDYYSKVYRNFSYLARGRYYEQLQRWMKYYKRDQLLILNSDDFFADPQSVLNEVCTFIGIGEYSPANLRVYNQRQYASMKPETRAHLREYFEPHNQKLYQLIGRKFEWDALPE
jgi:hypothetical protein